MIAIAIALLLVPAEPVLADPGDDLPPLPSAPLRKSRQDCYVDAGDLLYCVEAEGTVFYNGCTLITSQQAECRFTFRHKASGHGWLTPGWIQTRGSGGSAICYFNVLGCTTPEVSITEDVLVYRYGKACKEFKTCGVGASLAIHVETPTIQFVPCYDWTDGIWPPNPAVNPNLWIEKTLGAVENATQIASPEVHA